MKYLKLYESFKDEFNEDLKSIRDNYKNQLEKIKAEIKQSVDEYMSDVIDEYQEGGDSYVLINEIDDIFEVGYSNIECNLSKIDEFLDLIKDVATRIENQLGLNIRFQLSGDYTNEEGDIEELEFSDENILPFSQVKDDIDDLKRDISSHLKDPVSMSEKYYKRYTIILSVFVRS